MGKEIFHYIVAIKNRERNKQAASKIGEAPVKEKETLVKEPVHPFVRKEKETSDNIHSAIYQAAQNILKRSSFITGIVRMGLAKPVVLILLLLAAFILGIFLYCQISGSC